MKLHTIQSFLGLPLWLSWLRICLQCGRAGFDPWVGNIPWRRERLPTIEFWPGEFHGLYSPWGCKEWDMAELLSLSRLTELFSFLYLSNLKRILRQMKHNRNGIWTQATEYQRLYTQRLVHHWGHVHNKISAEITLKNLKTFIATWYCHKIQVVFPGGTSGKEPSYQYIEI